MIPPDEGIRIDVNSFEHISEILLCAGYAWRLSRSARPPSLRLTLGERLPQ
jgi:hypothetical protein